MSASQQHDSDFHHGNHVDPSTTSEISPHSNIPLKTHHNHKADDTEGVRTVIHDDDSPRLRLLEPSPEISSQRLSHDSDSDSDEDDPIEAPSEKPVTWASLPKKGQLAILTIARLSEPLTQTSLQAYLFYQLRSFDPSLPESTISTQAGLLQGSFTAAQFLTAVIWGRLADSEFMGRKRVLLIGLLGTSISCLGFGFSRSFAAAAVFRTLGGALNSNVGVMRTMISEIIEEKK
ncbi:uncharacterized protein BJX67DRAFT_344860 [Aspergillus lucknowensis]|uniref:Major facilitator superfamily (MFS) profile domain-containing protein n=1 Tax=Aspergillus lucknowensis TaxID=176173 RepID=A0ABR4M052_9EURO